MDSTFTEGRQQATGRGPTLTHTPSPTPRPTPTTTTSVTAPPPRVAVVGIGAVGGYFAARAALAGCDVTLCTHRPFDRLEVIYTGTAGPDGRELACAPPTRTVDDPSQLDSGPVDWVLVATKAHQTPAALSWLVPLVGPDTVVVVAQNGVRHVERVCPPVPAGQVLPAVVHVNAELVAPGVVRHRAYGFLQVPDCPAGVRLARRVLTGEGEVRRVHDFHSVAWTKLTANCAANSLTALTGRRLDVLGRRDVAELAVEVMTEAAAVAKADGADVRPDLPEFTVARLRGLPPGAGTSMLYDRLAGRPLEHEALIGAVVRIGAEHGVPTPVCQVLLALLAAVDDGATTASPN